MHFILELDAQRQHQPSHSVSSSESRQQTCKAGPESIDAARKDPPEVITCTLADVEALLSPFDQNQKGWRDAITAGELHAAAICYSAPAFPGCPVDTWDAVPPLGAACMSA